MSIDDFFEEGSKDLTIRRKAKGMILWFKATNGEGKSTIPHYMLENSNRVEYIKDGKKILATLFPEFGFASIGPYERGKTFGGCDSLHKEQVLKALEILKTYDSYDIIVEGILTGAGTLGTGTSKNGEAYYELLKNYPRAKRAYLFIESDWENVKTRIQTRTGKSDEDMEALKNVKKKYDACRVHKQKYLELGEVDVEVITNNGTKQEYIKEFFSRF
jgi:hypothetical protein